MNLHNKKALSIFDKTYIRETNGELNTLLTPTQDHELELCGELLNQPNLCSEICNHYYGINPTYRTALLQKNGLKLSRTYPHPEERRFMHDEPTQ